MFGGQREISSSKRGIKGTVLNNIYELTSVSGAQTHNFTYDGVGNRTNADGITYAPNNLNQYTQVGVVNYINDGNGNLTNDGVYTYGYDYENRLISAAGNGHNASYGYDGFGRRVSKTVDGLTTYFIYDGDQIIEERDASGTLIASYTYGEGIDEVLTMNRGAQTYYYFYDGLGSVTDITNPAGEVVESYSYDVYGQPNHQSSIGNPYYFTGRQLDTETGLYYYRARMYNPAIGRFMQRDPIGYYDSMNLYAYVNNNPGNWIDPWGWDKQKNGDTLSWQDELRRLLGPGIAYADEIEDAIPSNARVPRTTIGMTEREQNRMIIGNAIFGIGFMLIGGVVFLFGSPVWGTLIASGAVIYSGVEIGRLGYNTIKEYNRRQEEVIRRLYR